MNEKEIIENADKLLLRITLLAQHIRHLVDERRIDEIKMTLDLLEDDVWRYVDEVQKE